MNRGEALGQTVAPTGQTVVFVHGGWVTPACWDPFVSFFEARGSRCLAPAWPGKERSVESIRADPSPLAGLGIAEIVDHYERIIRSLDEPPILIGHSFGGLFVQLLLDRGLGAAGVAIDSAPPKGSSLSSRPRLRRSVGSSSSRSAGGRSSAGPSPSSATPSSTRCRRPSARDLGCPDRARLGPPFFQSAFSMLDRASPAGVDFANPIERHSSSSPGRRTAQCHRPSSGGCTAPTRPRPPGLTSARSQAGPTGSSPRTAGRRSPRPASTGSSRWIAATNPGGVAEVIPPRGAGALHAGRGRRRASDSQGRNEVSAETPRSAGTQPKGGNE